MSMWNVECLFIQEIPLICIQIASLRMTPSDFFAVPIVSLLSTVILLSAIICYGMFAGMTRMYTVLPSEDDSQREDVNVGGVHVVF